MAEVEFTKKELRRLKKILDKVMKSQNELSKLYYSCYNFTDLNFCKPAFGTTKLYRKIKAKWLLRKFKKIIEKNDRINELHKKDLGTILKNMSQFNAVELLHKTRKSVAYNKKDCLIVLNGLTDIASGKPKNENDCSTQSSKEGNDLRALASVENKQTKKKKQAETQKAKSLNLGLTKIKNNLSLLFL